MRSPKKPLFLALTVEAPIASPQRRLTMNRLIFCAVVTAAALLPFPAQAYELPVRGDDLAVGERFNTRLHLPGIQGEGHDIGARRHISDNNWSDLKFGGAQPALLVNWVVYGKPFYAMAPGTVIACWRNAPENIPGTLRPEVGAELIPGGGNHLWIKQDDGNFVLYAHAKPGSIPTSLCPNNGTLLPDSSEVGSKPSVRKWAAVANGAHVTTGQFLGRIGNSGQASGPHLHVHMEKNNMPVVMNFDHGMTQPFFGGVASFDGPWFKLAANAMPKADIVVWPRHPVGSWTFTGTPGHEYQALFDHMQDSGEMPDWVSCKADGATYNSHWIPAKGEWRSKSGMSDLEAQTLNALFKSQGFKRTSSYTCGPISVAVWRK
jgi:hypothetical protein